MHLAGGLPLRLEGNNEPRVEHSFQVHVEDQYQWRFLSYSHTKPCHACFCVVLAVQQDTLGWVSVSCASMHLVYRRELGMEGRQSFDAETL